MKGLKSKTYTKMRNDGNRFYQKVFFRLFLCFALVVLMFAILLSVIYMKLYETDTINSFRDDLIQKADRISQMVSVYAREQDKQGFNAYNSVIGSFFDKEKTDFYIISNVDSPYALAEDFTNYNSYHIDSLPEKTRKLLEAVYEGKIASYSGYDSMYYKQRVWVGVPIRNYVGNVSGAVMIASIPQDQMIVRDSQKYILISSIAALLISFIVSIFLARQFSEPISRMRRVALKLSEGDYAVKTEVTQGGEIGELATSIDILSVKLKENEEVRNNIEQMRRDFFANVSHELRTPITVMRGYTEMLVDGVVSKEEKKQQYYQRILKECTSMERLVGDLLILSKMQNPDFKIEKEPVNVIQVFQDIIRGIHVVAAKKNIRIDFTYNEECIILMGDYDRLRQMFMIILDNAIKFSNEDSLIKIDVQVHNKITIRITDQGVGISEEELPFIFEKFYKSKLRQNAQGSGLGLVIAKQIALKHDGEIHVESEVGKGTTFQFIFDKTCIEVL